jgi:transposase-like protein
VGDEMVTESARKSTPSSSRRSVVEVVTRGERRRRWSEEDRARILTEAMAPGAVVSHVARRFGVSTGQFYTWRKVMSCYRVSGVSAYGTKLAISVTEDFWLIVTPRRVKMSQKSSVPPTRVPAEKTGPRYSPRHAQAPFRRGQDPHRPGRAPRRGKHRRPLSPPSHRRELVLRLVQGILGSR